MAASWWFVECWCGWSDYGNTVDEASAKGTRHENEHKHTTTVEEVPETHREAAI